MAVLLNWKTQVEVGDLANEVFVHHDVTCCQITVHDLENEESRVRQVVPTVSDDSKIANVPKRRNGRCRQFGDLSKYIFSSVQKQKKIGKLHNLTTRRNSPFVNNTRQFLFAVRVISVLAKRTVVTNPRSKR